MAKEKEPPKKAAASQSAKSGKKSGKAKWILIFIIILLILAGIGYYFGLDRNIIAFIRNPELLLEVKDNLEVIWDGKKSGKPVPPVIEIEEKILDLAPAPPKMEAEIDKKYFVKVDDCVNKICQQEVIRFLKQQRFPYTQRKSNRHTKYFELISVSVYTRPAAKAKIDLLKMESEIMGDPYLVKENNRYRISLGQFPREDTGVRLKAELVNLYPKLKIEFELRPKNTRYQVTSIYAGPFKKSVAESVLKRLLENPEYETSEMTSSL